MAGYRPKSLDELNKIYDQTLEAEKAIRKGTSLLSDDSKSKPTEKELDAIKQKERELLAALEHSYKFTVSHEKETEPSVDVTPAEEAPVEEAVFTPVEEAPAEEIVFTPVEEAPAEEVIFTPVEEAPAEEIIFTPVEEAPAEEIAFTPVEEAPAEETVFTPVEEAPAEEIVFTPVEEAPAEEIVFTPVEEAPAEEVIFTPIEEAPVYEPQPPIIEQVINETPIEQEEAAPAEPEIRSTLGDKSSLIDDYMKIMNDEDDEADVPVIKERKLSRKEKKKLKKQQEAEKKNASALLQAEQESPAEAEEEVFGDISLSSAAEEYEAPETTEAPKSDPPSEGSFFTIEETVDENDEFSFPENYEPEWIGKDKAEDMKAEKEETDKKKTKKENKDSNRINKAILVLILAIVLAFGFFATTLKTFLAVNTGTAFNDNFYAFTAYKTYENANILEGDLVITENIFAEDGDIFAYINYDEKTFDFAKRTRSFVNGDDVLIVGVKEGERVLVSRDDCRGVVYTTYPGAGKYIAMVTDNYIVIMSALAVVALIIVLILIFGFRGPDKAEKKKAKKELKKAVSADDEEDLFGTIN